jgi:hypothetical protein
MSGFREAHVYGHPEKACCDTCLFWSYDGPEGVNTGQCRRHSPLYLFPSAWPTTDGRDWCGDWETHMTDEFRRKIGSKK